MAILKIKNLVFILLSVLIVILIFINWQYPFSPFSIQKSFTYKTDDIVIEQYNTELKSFKELYSLQISAQESNGFDLTTNRIQYLLQMYDQHWLTNTDSTNVTHEQLDNHLFELREARKLIIELAFSEEYSKNVKEYLKMLLEDNLFLEEALLDMKHSSFDSRKTLHRRYRNIHRGYIKNFDIFNSFYRVYLMETK